MIKVIICQGTVCHVMGGADLLLAAELLPAHIKEQVQFEGTVCLGLCNKEDNTTPPYVMVNDKIIDKVTITKLINTITAEF